MADCQKDPPPTKQQMRKAGYVEYCEVRGSQRKCTWITREELERMLRDYERMNR